MIISIIQALFKIKIQLNMSEQEKKQQRIYDLLNAETEPKKKTTSEIFEFLYGLHQAQTLSY